MRQERDCPRNLHHAQSQDRAFLECDQRKNLTLACLPFIQVFDPVLRSTVTCTNEDGLRSIRAPFNSEEALQDSRKPTRPSSPHQASCLPSGLRARSLTSTLPSAIVRTSADWNVRKNGPVLKLSWYACEERTSARPAWNSIKVREDSRCHHKRPKRSPSCRRSRGWSTARTRDQRPWQLPRRAG